jgi:hypothetical protein
MKPPASSGTNTLRNLLPDSERRKFGSQSGVTAAAAPVYWSTPGAVVVRGSVHLWTFLRALVDIKDDRSSAINETSAARPSFHGRNGGVCPGSVTRVPTRTD